MDQLPGFPDGITTSSSGSFWVGLVVPQQPIIAWLENRCRPVSFLLWRGPAVILLCVKALPSMLPHHAVDVPI